MDRVSGLAERIRILILRGELAPGEMLIEVLLAEQLRSGLGAIHVVDVLLCHGNAGNITSRIAHAPAAICDRL